MEIKSILEMARGAIMEQVDIETSKVVDNIIDPNTDPKKKRTITLKVDFIPSADRQTVTVIANAQSKLVPNGAVQTSLFVGIDPSTGEVAASEMTPEVPGQISLSGNVTKEPPVLRMVSGGK